MAISIDHLIECVKKNEVLFNMSHSQYKNVRIRNKIWDEIAKEMKLGPAGGNKLKKRWKGLRDCYAKYLRAQTIPTGQTPKTIDRYKSWPWAKQMEVFKPFLKFLPKDSTATYTGESSDLSDVFYEEQKPFIGQQDEQVAVTTTTPQGKRRRSDTAGQCFPLDNNIDFFTEQRSANRHSSDELDLVFQGYAASVKKLSPRHQTIVKFKIAKIIMEAELLQHAEMETSSQTGPCMSNASFSDTYSHVLQSDDTSSLSAVNETNAS